MIRQAFHWGLMGVGAAGAALAIAFVSNAQSPQQAGGPQPGGGMNGPGYQRHASDSSWRGRDRWRKDRSRGQYSPQMQQVQAGYFQRPYPFHLDYYKMRFGGSYAPYFGNLYGTPFGTPQVVNGGWGGEPGGPPPQVNGMSAYPPGMIIEQPQQVQAQSVGVLMNTPADGTTTKPEATATENLPVPSK